MTIGVGGDCCHSCRTKLDRAWCLEHNLTQGYGGKVHHHKRGRFTVKRMSCIRHLVDQLRRRSDVDVIDEAQSWRICIAKGGDLICEVTIPHEALEWHVDVKQRRDHKTVSSDWMDYAGYNERPRKELEAEMAGDVLAFIDRISAAEQLLPLKIDEANA